VCLCLCLTLVTQHAIDVRSRNIVTVEKNITYSECVVVSNLSNLACKAHAPYYIVIHSLFGFTTFFHNFRETFTEHKICILNMSAILSEMFLIQRNILRDFILHIRRFSRKLHVTC